MQIESLQAELIQWQSQLAAAAKETNDHQASNLLMKAKVCASTSERDACLVRNAELSQQLALCRQQLVRSEAEADQLGAKCSQLERDNGRVQLLLDDAEARDDNSERVAKLRSQIVEFESVVAEKNKTIKLQQQRLADMKKTLQKELKAQNNGGGGTDSAESAAAAANGLSPVPGRRGSNVSPTLVGGSPARNDAEEVNVKYLKHVIFNFSPAESTR